MGLEFILACHACCMSLTSMFKPGRVLILTNVKLLERCLHITYSTAVGRFCDADPAWGSLLPAE